VIPKFIYCSVSNPLRSQSVHPLLILLDGDVSGVKWWWWWKEDPEKGKSSFLGERNISSTVDIHTDNVLVLM
jgi:hypothetical protein